MKIPKVVCQYGRIESVIYNGASVVQVLTQNPALSKMILKEEADKWGQNWKFYMRNGNLYIRQLERKPIVINPDFDIRPLAAAVLYKAICDARGHDATAKKDARAWLSSDASKIFLEFFDVYIDISEIVSLRRKKQNSTKHKKNWWRKYAQKSITSITH